MIGRRSVLAAGVLAPLGWAAAAETRYPARSVTVVQSVRRRRAVRAHRPHRKRSFQAFWASPS